MLDNPMMPPGTDQAAAPLAGAAAAPAPTTPTAKARQISEVETRWPMFTVRKRLDPAGSVWVEIDDVKGLRDTAQWQKIMDEVHRLEEVCWAEGFRGWLVAVPHGNDRLERWLPVIGGKAYHKDAKFTWYHKYVLADPDGKVQRTIPGSPQDAVKAYRAKQQPVLPGEETR